MLDIRRKKVKAIYFNAFHCPECGLELHQDNIVLTTYPAQYCYYCDCGFRTTSFQTPGYEYEFEEEDLPPAYPERIKELFLNQEPIPDDVLFEFNNLGLRQDIDADTLKRISTAINNSTVSTSQAIANLIALGESFADKTGGISYV